jgi:hypothetical protein
LVDWLDLFGCLSLFGCFGCLVVWVRQEKEKKRQSDWCVLLVVDLALGFRQGLAVHLYLLYNIAAVLLLFASCRNNYARMERASGE